MKTLKSSVSVLICDSRPLWECLTATGEKKRQSSLESNCGMSLLESFNQVHVNSQFLACLITTHLSETDVSGHWHKEDYVSIKMKTLKSSGSVLICENRSSWLSLTTTGRKKRQNNLESNCGMSPIESFNQVHVNIFIQKSIVFLWQWDDENVSKNAN